MIEINVSLVKQLIRQQFPQWTDLQISPVEHSGWDNRTFHLGEDMLVRLPSDAIYSNQVEKEQYWLPRLQQQLPLKIPHPIAMGAPSTQFPLNWSIYKWMKGETVSNERVTDLIELARSLANFLNALRQCDTNNAPLAGPDNFYRGGNLKIYDNDTKQAIAKLENDQHAKTLTKIWEKALQSTWQDDPVWIHGDIAIGNLLVKNGKFIAVIDFGQLAIGDPACDLVIYWTFLSGHSREIFRKVLNLDNETWDRARGWVLWKTLCAPVSGTDCEKILNEIINDFGA